MTGVPAGDIGRYLPLLHGFECRLQKREIGDIFIFWVACIVTIKYDTASVNLSLYKAQNLQDCKQVKQESRHNLVIA